MRHLSVEPDELEQGLARLVLSVIELLRQLLEREAVRQMEDGLLADAEADRLGTAFYRLQGKMEEMTAAFGLSPEDLNLDLGPLGRLL